MKFLGIIPARYSSTRFPGKPLVLIKGKSMIQRVYEQATQSKILEKVVIATDDERIFKHAVEFNGNVEMTSKDHRTGTDRCAEIAGLPAYKDFDVIINIQGDEPFINPEQIGQVASCFASEKVELATLIKPLTDKNELGSNTIIKLVTDLKGRALYFSRAPIPFVRDTEEIKKFNAQLFYKHIGIYAYRIKTLLEITKLNQSPLELAESLEQLRWLENGYSIYTTVTQHESHSVDVPGDIDKF